VSLGARQGAVTRYPMIVMVPLLLTAEAHLGSDRRRMGSPDGATSKALRRDSNFTIF